MTAALVLSKPLGARLLQRSTRRVSLTDAGEQTIPSCQRILALAEEAEEQVRGAQGELRGTLRVACGPSFGKRHLLPALLEFQRQHPRLNLRLNFSDSRVNLIGARSDLAIRVTASPDPALYARRLSLCRSLLVASPAYIAQYGVPKTPADLALIAVLRTNASIETFGSFVAQKHTKKFAWKVRCRATTKTLCWLPHWPALAWRCCRDFWWLSRCERASCAACSQLGSRQSTLFMRCIHPKRGCQSPYGIC